MHGIDCVSDGASVIVKPSITIIKGGITIARSKLNLSVHKSLNSFITCFKILRALIFKFEIFLMYFLKLGFGLDILFLRVSKFGFIFEILSLNFLKFNVKGFFFNFAILHL